MADPLLPSTGVEFCDFPLRTKDDLDLVPFNDLSIVEGWSTPQRVEGIKEIVLYHEENLVVGIELVYRLEKIEWDGSLRIIDSPRITHGKKTKLARDRTTISVGTRERVIGAFVGIEMVQQLNVEDKLRSLRFAKTNLDNGDVVTEGYEPLLGGYGSFTAFGEISAFRGTKIRGDEGRLVTLGVQTRYIRARLAF